MKIALITGITGQDGSYLAELLLGKGYVVHGVIRRASSFNTQRINHIYENASLHLHYGDMLDAASLRSILTHTQPDEVYNLAAQSHVKTSFDQPVYSVEVAAIGTLNLLEAIRDYRDATGYNLRFYQACSSEMYGNATVSPQNEETPFRPCSPYACAKAYTYWQVVNYRHAYDLHASNGVLFNHESPRRGETFVTRKITRAVARIKLGLQETVCLGNLQASRDWGFAGDYVEAMWLMLQQDAPGDYVIATGVEESVCGWMTTAFKCVDLAADEYYEQDQRYLRPTEVDRLCGDARKAKRVLGWEPKVLMPELCRMMVDSDMQLARQEVAVRNAAGTSE